MAIQEFKDVPVLCLDSTQDAHFKASDILVCNIVRAKRLRKARLCYSEHISGSGEASVLHMHA